MSLSLVSAVLFASVATADPASDVKTNVARLGQAHHELRQSVIAFGPSPQMQSVEVLSRWSAYVDETKAKGGAVDPNALVQTVLREAYLQTTEDLRFFAEKVKYFNACKKQVRDYLQHLRDYDAKMRRSAAASPFEPPLASLERSLTALEAQEPALAKLQNRLAQRAARLDPSAPGPRDANLMEALARLLKEQMREANEDKKYYLERLRDLNRITEAIVEEQKKLAAASASLAERESKKGGR